MAATKLSSGSRTSNSGISQKQSTTPTQKGLRSNPPTKHGRNDESGPKKGPGASGEYYGGGLVMFGRCMAGA